MHSPFGSREGQERGKRKEERGKRAEQTLAVAGRFSLPAPRARVPFFFLVLHSSFLLSILAACGGDTEAAAKVEEAPSVVSIGPENIAVVQMQELAAGPALSGSLAPEREATLRAQIPGPVLAVLVDQGTRVRTGQALARLDDRTVRDAFLSARSALATVQSSASMAARELARAERLAAAGAIADRDLETARWNNEASQSQLADAQARLTLAQKQLNDATVRAPFNGIVSQRQVSAGDIVQPGGALFTVVDPSSMRLEAAVPAAQLTAIKVGSPVVFTVSGYPGRTFEGRIARVSPLVDAATGQVQLTASIPNARADLVGGLFAEGRVTASKHQGLVAPLSAVDAQGIKPAVSRLKAGKVERVEVQIGLRDESTEQIELVSGVAAGDTLLIGAAQGISAGTMVRVSGATDAPAPAPGVTTPPVADKKS